LDKKVLDGANKYATSNNLSLSFLVESYLNPYIGWLNSSKIMEKYGVNLPRYVFRDLEEGVEVVPLSIKESEYYFYYEYQMNEDGSYQSFATITDEQGLEELIEE
jgi:hypothetical protein